MFDPPGRQAGRDGVSVERFRKVPVCIWKEGWFRGLSPDAQRLVLYLMTSGLDTAIPGLFSATMGGLADELGCERMVLSATWQDISGQFVGEADWEAGVLWLPAAFDANQPASPNNVTAWRSYLREVPACPLKEKALAYASRHCKARDRALGGNAFARAFDSLRQLSLDLRLKWSAAANESPLAEAESLSRASAQEGDDCADRQPQSPEASEPAPKPAKTKAEHGPGGDGPAGVWLFPCRASRGGPSTWALDQAELERLERLFPEPEIDVKRAIASAQDWCRLNPRRRKTAQHMARFMRAWLERDRLAIERRKAAAKKYQEAKKSTAERQAEAIRELGRRDDERRQQDESTEIDYASNTSNMRAIMASLGFARETRGATI